MPKFTSIRERVHSPWRDDPRKVAPVVYSLLTNDQRRADLAAAIMAGQSEALEFLGRHAVADYHQVFFGSAP